MAVKEVIIHSDEVQDSNYSIRVLAGPGAGKTSNTSYIGIRSTETYKQSSLYYIYEQSSHECRKTCG